MPSEFQRAIRRRLKAVADPAVARGYEWYFKHTVHFIGVRAPGVKRIAREESAGLRHAAVGDVLREAFALLRSKWMEEKQVSGLLLAAHTARFPDDFFERLTPVFEDGVADWATCDLYSGRVFRRLLVTPHFRRRIVSWSGAKNLWRQRASAVAFVGEARHGRHTRDILTVCERTVQSPERFVQLGTGWVLRELCLAEPDVVLEFLRRHYAHISREGLRYAIEKMPKELQAQLLGAHVEAGGLKRRRGKERR